jgi:hypothetical protein
MRRLELGHPARPRASRSLRRPIFAISAIGDSIDRAAETKLPLVFVLSQ